MILSAELNAVLFSSMLVLKGILKSSAGSFRVSVSSAVCLYGSPLQDSSFPTLTLILRFFKEPTCMKALDFVTDPSLIYVPL